MTAASARTPLAFVALTGALLAGYLWFLVARTSGDRDEVLGMEVLAPHRVHHCGDRGGRWNMAYIHLIQGDAPAALTVADASPTGSDGGRSSTNVGDDPSGAWNVANGSKVGYRVNEDLFGQTHEAVGRDGRPRS